MIPEQVKKAIVSDLMRWFEASHREMPWRGESDPYKIWVSEVMLQQTQVATVIPYYHRWMTHFPNLKTLASADLNTVLNLWEGLGYYNRAANLVKGAQYVRENHNGQFPNNYNEALNVPGVGPYIAGAVISMAYNKPEPAVDGNVLRVLARLYAMEEVSTTNRFKRKIRNVLKNSFFDQPPCWLNQAWMEFGALQCTPSPDCRLCPLNLHCQALQTDRVKAFPVKKKKKQIPVRHGRIYLIHNNQSLFLVRRPHSGLLRSLWECPNVMLDEMTESEFMRKYPVTPANESCGKVIHVYSHFKVVFHVFPARLSSTWKNDFWIDSRWVDFSNLHAFPKPAAHIKVLKQYVF